MEQTLQALAGILLKSIPTICLLLFLYVYLKLMLFGPLAKVLKQRDALTAGTRDAADESLKAAERKVEQYEAQMREARAEVYREQEELRRGWLAEQAAQVAEARESTAASTARAREQMAAEMTAARQTLTESSGELADQIATALLTRRTK
jgi:F-type H+-transporting ATPase subunit b